MKKLAARRKNAAWWRRMETLFTTKKAISPVIATLLLTLLTFTVGIFFYNYVTGHIGTMKTNLQQQMELLFLRSASVNNTHITSYVGNNGIWDISIVTAYVNDQLGILSQTVQIGKGSVEPVYVIGTYIEGLTYTVKLVSNFGVPLTFSVMYQ